MTSSITFRSSRSLNRHGVLSGALVPILPSDLTIRPACRADILFIDQLQKHFQGCLGFMWDTVLEKKIEKGEIRVAVNQGGTRFGYCMAAPTYMTNERCGIIYQLAVVPVRHRRQVGASLIRDFFANAPYQMKLACCWCAQDLHANHFWESMGFLPIAFRTGSRGRQRVHIFWERRVRRGDTRTPFWFPAKTTGGAVAEDRLVIPMPPGTSWQDAKPVLLPGRSSAGSVPLLENGLPDPAAAKRAKALPAPQLTPAERLQQFRERAKGMKRAPKGFVKVIKRGGVQHMPTGEMPEAVKPKRPPKPRAKANKEHTDACAELQARYLEHLETLDIAEEGKYDPSRLIEEAPSKLGGLQSLLETATNLNQMTRLESSGSSSSPLRLPSFTGPQEAQSDDGDAPHEAAD